MTGTWQPIDTAPVSVPVLVYDDGNVYQAIGSPAAAPYTGTWWTAWDPNECEYLWAIQPTYWMPIPDKPREGKT